jgi:hypothetical protein
MLGQSAQMEQCKLAVQVCTITKFNKQEGNIMAKTIYEKIMTRKITSVELKSVLGREFYTYASGNWWLYDEENDDYVIYTPEKFCQYIADCVECAEQEKFYLEIHVGKAKHREVINLVKERLTEFFSEHDYSFFPEFYKTLSAKEKKAAVLILNHSELFDYGCIPVMYPSTSELTLLWKGSKKLKNALLVPIKGPDYELTVNLFTGEVVDYMDMDIIEGNF